MSKQGPASLRSVHQSPPRENITGDWADPKGLTVSANVGSSGDGPISAARGTVQAAGASEVEHLRILGNNVDLGDEINADFVTDCVRNIEGLRSDQELKETWGLDEHRWSQLSKNAPLLDAIKAERERRIHNGEAAREAAQRHFANTPSVLSEILHNEAISPRHRIEAAKELRQVACSSPEKSTSAGGRFVIRIDLGADHRLVKDFDLPACIPGDDGTLQ
ncbi:hypothetical protein [Bradyrhizobium sp. JYMT SZCCT0428]|uniref:hypothetical protein n=1 Tax=Bradyrhizobium sp. JYMT SZCCT0428 TaxID=2807673 RepID=UPI001BA7D748|nr:hypothetical protein [Bradyrhizobium sp. JYMT SZCCT0428]MBR1153742.1 hypothetical protein [Bradyrhizobium sp. JYMT SZCCT0428]